MGKTSRSHPLGTIRNERMNTKCCGLFPAEAGGRPIWGLRIDIWVFVYLERNRNSDEDTLANLVRAGPGTNTSRMGCVDGLPVAILEGRTKKICHTKAV